MLLGKESAESPRMFESDWVDRFSRCHWLAVPLLYVPGMLVALEMSARRGVGTGTAALLLAVGFALWTLAEYWLHRLVFHFQSTRPWGERLHFLIHGVHHRWPRDRYRLVMPPGASIPLYFAFLGLFVLVLGRFGWGLHAGFVAGYMFYDLTHYFLHHGVPKGKYGRRLRRNHMLHHFKDPDAHFGVSNLVWDVVFGTMGDVRSRASAREFALTRANSAGKSVGS